MKTTLIIGFLTYAARGGRFELTTMFTVSFKSKMRYCVKETTRLKPSTKRKRTLSKEYQNHLCEKRRWRSVKTRTCERVARVVVASFA